MRYKSSSICAFEEKEVREASQELLSLSGWVGYLYVLYMDSMFSVLFAIKISCALSVRLMFVPLYFPPKVLCGSLRKEFNNSGFEGLER